MDVQVRHTPSFAVVRCTMAGGEAVRAESGAMMATSDGVTVEAKMQGGLMKSLKRSVLGGESLFIATAQGGWVDCAANLPGDAVVRTVGGGKTLNMSRGSFLVCESGVEIDTQWGGFLVHASGEGEVVAACYGALDTITLGPGERVVVDSGHMVAYDDTVQMSIRARGRHDDLAQERRGARVRLHRARPDPDPDPQPFGAHQLAHNGAPVHTAVDAQERSPCRR